MKKLLLILFLFTGYTTFAQGKIGGEGNVIPTGNYPIVASKDIKGTLHTFKTIVQRDALSANYKDTGMLAYVVDSLKYYKWNGTDWEEFKTGGDAPTDYFNSYTQAPDSSYLQTNRKDGTKQYVVIQADGLTGTGGGSGGDNSLTWEQTLQNQGEIAFSSDNSVDLGGHELNISTNGNGDVNNSYSILTQNSNQIGGEWGTDTTSAGYGANLANANSEAYLYAARFGGMLPDNSHQISVYPDRIQMYNANNHDVNLQINNLDSSNANPNNIAWFDENNILHRGAVFIDSTVTLSSGTITVSDTRVHTGAKIFVSVNTPSGTQGFLSAKTSDIVDGTSFIINSTSATDNSTVNYEIINP